MDKIAKGTSLLLISSIIVKVLSAIYRIPFQNIVGNEGFYIYQQVYPIYGLGMTIALTGIPMYISKYIIEYKDNNNKIQELFSLLFFINSSIFLILILFSKQIASLMGNEKLYPLIIVSAMIFILCPYLAMYRGFYQSHMDLKPTSISQLLEQFIRVVVIIIASFVMMGYHFSLYSIGTVCMIGSVLGSIVALMILIFYKTNYKLSLKLTKVSIDTIKKFFTEGFLLILSVGFLLIFQLIDSFLISNQLQSSGYSFSESANLKGIYDRGQPMIQVGLVLTTVFLQSFIPLLTKSHVNKDIQKVNYYKNLLIKSLLIVAIPITIGLIILMPEINWMLFDNQEGNFSLQILSISIIFMSSLQCFQVIDQNLSVKNHLFIPLIIGIISKIILTYWLVLKIGIIGGSLSTILSLLIANMFYLVFNKIRFDLKLEFFRKYIFILSVYILLLITYQVIISINLNNRLMAILFSILGIILNGSFLIILIIKTKVFSLDELQYLPLGEKIYNLLERNNENR